MNHKLGEIVRNRETHQSFHVIGINKNNKYALKDSKGGVWDWVSEHEIEKDPSWTCKTIPPKFEIGSRPLLKKCRQRSTITEIWWKDGGFYYKLESIENGDREEDGLFPEVMFSREVEEKLNLNLWEILRGKEKQEFFSYSNGPVILDEINDKEGIIYVRRKGIAVGREMYDLSGKVFKNGLIDLYPSEELLKKYPLEAEKAWEEWENTEGSLEKVVEYNALKFHCEECIDDSDYSIAKGGILVGLKLSQKFNEEDIKNYLNNNKQWIQ